MISLALTLLGLVPSATRIDVAQDPPVPPSRAPVRVVVAGTRVKMAPPTGFVPGVGFTGFRLPETGVSILVNEMRSVPFAELAKGLDEAGLKRAGMKLLTKETATIGGRDGVLLHISQMMEEVEFQKWMAVCGDAKSSVMIMGVFPAVLAQQHSDVLKRVVLDAVWDPTLVVDPFADLDWTIDVPSQLKFADRTQKVLIFNVGGDVPAKDPSAPMLIVAPSLDAMSIDDLKSYAEKRVRQTPGLSKFDVRRSESIQVAGFAGWELAGHATYTKTKSEHCFYQLMLVREEGYVIVQGLAAVEYEKEYTQLFEKAARSWKPKPAAKPEPPVPK
jgi:hypothetical protein